MPVPAVIGTRGEAPPWTGRQSIPCDFIYLNFNYVSSNVSIILMMTRYTSIVLIRVITCSAPSGRFRSIVATTNMFLYARYMTAMFQISVFPTRVFSRTDRERLYVLSWLNSIAI